MIEEITLDQLLASRDKRRERQQTLLKQYENMSLVCLTVIMPGSVKRNSLSLTIAKEAINALQKAFSQDKITHFEEYDLPTGYEAFFAVNMPNDKTKRIVCNIESTHPLGRLFDIDVIKQDGTPMSRTEMGLAPRRCIICNQEVRHCMRQRLHSTTDLIQAISEIVDNYNLANSNHSQ